MKRQNIWKKCISLFLCLFLIMVSGSTLLMTVESPLQEVLAAEKSDSDSEEEGKKTEKESNKTDATEEDKKEDISGEEMQGKRKTKVSVKIKNNPTYSDEKVDPEDFLTVEVKEIVSGEIVKNPELRYNFYTRSGSSSEPSDSDYLTSVPKNVGDYWVQVYYKGDAGRKAATSGYRQFSIGQATPKIVFATNMTDDTCIGDTIRITVQLQIPGKNNMVEKPNGQVVFYAAGELIGTVKFEDGKASVDYVLASGKNTISAEFVPSKVKGTENNLRRSSGVLKDIEGKKKDQDSQEGGAIRKVYGAKPFKLDLSNENGTGAYTFESSDKSVATVAADGTVTILHPGNTKITVTKAADDTYNASTAVYELTVIKGENTDKPKKIVEKEVTTDKIVVNVVEGQEYSVDGGKNWNTTGIFKKLKANKEYTVITRLCETEYYAASSKTAYLKLKTSKQKLDKVDQDKDSGHSSNQNFGLGTGNKVNSLKGNDSQQVTTANRVGGTASSTSKEGTRKVNTLGKEEGQTAVEEETEESTPKEEATSTEAEETTTEGEVEEEQKEELKRSSTATVKAGMSVLILALAALTFIYFNKRETNL